MKQVSFCVHVYLLPEDRLEPPDTLGVVRGSVGLRWCVALRSLVKLADIVPFLHRLLHQLLVRLFLHMCRPAQYLRHIIKPQLLS